MRLVVLASGGGTTFQAIAEAAAAGDLPATVTGLVTDRPGIGVLERAERLGVASSILRPGDFGDASAFGDALLEAFEEYGATFVALAGYLRKIPAAVVDEYRHRLLNIHPALLPAFGGKGMYGPHVHRAVLDYGARWTGPTVHLVDAAYDTGPVVAQVPVPVRPGDTPATLAARVQPVERRLYPAVLRCFAEGRVSVEGRRVDIQGERPEALFSVSSALDVGARE